MIFINKTCATEKYVIEKINCENKKFSYGFPCNISLGIYNQHYIIMTLYAFGHFRLSDAKVTRARTESVISVL